MVLLLVTKAVLLPGFPLKIDCVKANLGRSRERDHFMTSIVAALYILLLGLAWPTYAAEQLAEATKQGHEKRLRAELEELHGYLLQSHQGKRGDDERYVILHRMLQDYGLLKSTGTAEAQGAIQEWHELLEAHPEYREHPPRLEIREQREVREKQKKDAAESQAKAGSWMPQDSRPVATYGLGRKAVLQYQYHVDFFKLSDSEKIMASSDFSRVTQAVNIGSLRPFKVMKFRHPLDFYWLPGDPFDHPILLCENFVSRYTARTPEEMAVIGRGMKWENRDAEHDGFCGVVSLDGDILFEFPVTQRYPDAVFHVLQFSKDGKSAAIGVGKEIEDGSDEGTRIGSYREVLIWEYPDKLIRVDASDRSEVGGALQAHGLNPSVLGR